MTTYGEKFRALLATGRVANLPTVWSNVLVGFWFASHLTRNQDHYSAINEPWFYSILFLFAIFTASCIYLAGCLLGDAKDLEFDRIHRPSRPLPMGVLHAPKVSLLAYILFGLALVFVSLSTFIAAIIQWWTYEKFTLKQFLNTFTDKSSLFALQPHEIVTVLILCTCVIAYAYFHKRSRKLGLSLITLSRFLLVIFGVAVTYKTFFLSSSSTDPLQFSIAWLKPWMLYLALAVACHTLLLSWVASTESQPGIFNRRAVLAFLMILIPLGSFAFNASLPHYDHISQLWGNVDSDMQETMIGKTAPNHFIHVLCLLICYTWLAYALYGLRTSKPAFVSRALAGFCLLDACFAAAHAPGISLVCLGLFALAILLQRVTPAT